MDQTKIIGNMRYNVSARVSGFQHLCTFKEVSDIKLSVQKKSERFDSYQDHNADLTEDELNLVSSMFAKLCTMDSSVSSDTRGHLFSISTGNEFRWSYTEKQNKQWMPIINHIVPDSTMMLYNEDKGNGKYVELTMFKINLSKSRELARKLDTYEAVLSANLPEPVEPVSTELTEEAIRAYLQGI